MIYYLKLENFRKFVHLNLEFKNKVVIFVGPNATGKTTLLEAIYFIATSKSHRTTDLVSLIEKNQEFASIELATNKKFKIVLSKENRQNFINDIPFSKLSEFIGKFPVILFSPTDINIIQGSKSIRRHFIDIELSLMDKNYLQLLIVYKKIMKERNELLKIYSLEKKLMLDVLTQQMIEYILKIYKIRIDFINLLNEKLKQICKSLNSELVELTYLPSYDIKKLNESFQLKLNYDLLTKTTNIGLHRDDFKIELENIEAKNFASEGQQRNAILAIKLALKEIYKIKKQEVIILLDDVFASMDQKRINFIMKYIENEHQVFITTTSLFNIPDVLLKDAQIIRL